MSAPVSANSNPLTRLFPPINWRAARAMFVSEARLLLRNPGVVLWTAILPVAAAITLG